MNAIIKKYYIESLEFEHDIITSMDKICIYEACLDLYEDYDYTYESVVDSIKKVIQKIMNKIKELINKIFKKKRNTEELVDKAKNINVEKVDKPLETKQIDPQKAIDAYNSGQDMKKLIASGTIATVSTVGAIITLVKNKKIQNAYDSLQKSLQDKNKEVEKLTNELKDALTERNMYCGINADLSYEVNHPKDEAKKKIERLEAERDKLKKENDRNKFINMELLEAELKIKKLEDEIAEQKQIIANLEKEKNQSKTKIQTSPNNKSETQLKDDASRKKEVQKQLSSLNEQISNANITLGAISSLDESASKIITDIQESDAEDELENSTEKSTDKYRIDL